MREFFEGEGFSLSPQEEELFNKYLQMILSASFNVTSLSLRDPVAIIYRHFIDSLYVTKFLDFSSFEKLLDVGTGGGFPGIPLKIKNPHLKVFLLESSEKKTSFLREVVKELELKDVEVLSGRAEELAKNLSLRERMDVVVARALAPLNISLELTIPFVKVNGLFITYKGKKVFDEIAEARRAFSLLYSEVERVEEYYIKGIDFKGFLLFIRKKEETPLKYPRKTGIPAKRPL